MRVQVWVLGFRVQVLGLRVEGSGLGFRVEEKPEPSLAEGFGSRF